MTYSSGGVIAAADYNTFVGTSPSSTANTINTIWAVGNGARGYGQTALSQVSATGLVTATQWASAINALNSIKTHQTGSGTGIGAPTAGGLISYLSTFSSAISTAYSNGLTFNSQGSTQTGSGYGATFSATNDATYGESTYATRTVTFASADQARYFFNAGGQINLVITGVINNDSTARSTDAVNTIGTYLGGVSAFRAFTNGGYTGSGGIASVNNTSFGYFNLTTSYIQTQKIATSSGTYTTDYAAVYWKSNGVVGSNGDAGSVINIALNYYSSHSSGFNDTLNVTVNHRIDVVYPETTNLSNTWGTVTIA